MFQPLEVTAQAMMATWHLASSCHLWQGLPTPPRLGAHPGPPPALRAGNTEQARPGRGPLRHPRAWEAQPGLSPGAFWKTAPFKTTNKDVNPTRGEVRCAAPRPPAADPPPCAARKQLGHRRPLTAAAPPLPARPPAARPPAARPAAGDVTPAFPLAASPARPAPPRPLPLLPAGHWRSQVALTRAAPLWVAGPGGGAGASAVARRRSAARPGRGARVKRVLGGWRLRQGRAGSERDEAVSGWVRGAAARPGSCQAASLLGGKERRGWARARARPRGPAPARVSRRRPDLSAAAGRGGSGQRLPLGATSPPILPPRGLGGGRAGARGGWTAPVRRPPARPEGPLSPAVGRRRPLWSPRACFPSPAPTPTSASPRPLPRRGARRTVSPLVSRPERLAFGRSIGGGFLTDFTGPVAMAVVLKGSCSSSSRLLPSPPLHAPTGLC